MPVADPVPERATGPTAGDWIALLDGPLPVAEAHAWAVRPDCGAVVMFTGTARDHSEGRRGVDRLAYEAYAEQVVPRLGLVADELRRRWPTVGRVALIHRVGEVPLGQEAVVVVVSAPHREEAFAAARYGIDAVKATVPIWKRESWRDGDDWGLRSRPLVGVDAVEGPPPGGAAT